MKLAGDLAEFSLADLVQVAGLARRTCCVKVMTAEGNGALYLDGGEVVSAACEDLTGFDAFVALIAARAGHFQVENDAHPTQRDLQGNVQKLLLEANTRIEAGDVPRPRRRPPAVPAAATPTAAAAARQGGRSWLIAAAAAALVLVCAISWLAFARHEVSTAPGGAAGEAAIPAAAPAATAVEASRLTGPQDAMPTLVAGQPPAAPDAGAALKPTVVCRLLLDAEGRVTDAKIYRSRMDLAAFEDAALDAARKYRFTPGRLAGKPVPVWINWSVTFR